MCVKTREIPDAWRTSLMLWFSRKSAEEQLLVIGNLDCDDMNPECIAFYVDRTLIDGEVRAFWAHYMDFMGNYNKSQQPLMPTERLNTIQRLPTSAWLPNNYYAFVSKFEFLSFFFETYNLQASKAVFAYSVRKAPPNICPRKLHSE
jgi:hypothetical protein